MVRPRPLGAWPTWWMAAVLGAAGAPRAGTEESRPPALSPVEAEHRKAVAAFSAGCLQVADRATGEDPDLERRALRALLVADPAHDRARARLAALGEAATDLVAASRTGRHIPAWATQWQDLVADGSFGATPAEAHLLTVEEGSGFVRPDRAPSTGRRYVLEAEVRFVEQRGGWIFGLAFGEDGGGTCSAFLNVDTVVLDESRDNVVAVLSSQLHKGAPKGTWLTLAAVVDGGRVSVWLNGQPYLRDLMPKEGDLGGSVGIMRRGCKVEVRSLWLGRGT